MDISSPCWLAANGSDLNNITKAASCRLGTSYMAEISMSVMHAVGLQPRPADDGSETADRFSPDVRPRNEAGRQPPAVCGSARHHRQRTHLRSAPAPTPAAAAASVSPGQRRWVAPQTSWAAQLSGHQVSRLAGRSGGIGSTIHTPHPAVRTGRSRSREPSIAGDPPQTELHDLPSAAARRRRACITESRIPFAPQPA